MRRPVRAWWAAVAVVALGAPAAWAQEQEPGRAPAAEEDVDDPGLAQPAVPPGQDPASKLLVDEDEDQAPTPPPAPQVAGPTPPAAVRAPAAPVVAPRPLPPPPARSPDAQVTDEEFDPFAERPVRGYLGAAGVGSYLLNQPAGRTQVQAGAGVNVYAGVDLGPWLGLEVGYLGSFHNPGPSCGDAYAAGICSATYLTFDLLSIDGKLHMPTGTPIVPYLVGGASLAWVGQENKTPTAMGAGFDFGGGIEGWIGNSVTLGAKVMYRALKVNDLAPPDSGQRQSFVGMLSAGVDLGFHF